MFFDEEEKAVAPYISYSPPSDAETEMTESLSTLSRTNSFNSLSSPDSDGPEDLPRLVRDFAFKYDPSSSTNHSLATKKRPRSPDNEERETELKRIALDGSI